MSRSQQIEHRGISFFKEVPVVVLLLLCVNLFSCGPKKTESTNAQESSTKFQQYYVQGEKLYLMHCSNCHQKNGNGLGLVYPPLKQSDYMTQNVDEVLCLMRYGINGALTVNGKSYNQNMPGIPTLGDLEIAEIATYIYNTWGNNHGLIDVQQVTKIKKNCDGSGVTF
jgi:mono/diheme cytochrome c family protein